MNTPCYLFPRGSIIAFDGTFGIVVEELATTVRVDMMDGTGKLGVGSVPKDRVVIRPIKPNGSYDALTELLATSGCPTAINALQYVAQGTLANCMLLSSDCAVHGIELLVSPGAIHRFLNEAGSARLSAVRSKLANLFNLLEIGQGLSPKLVLRLPKSIYGAQIALWGADQAEEMFEILTDTTYIELFSDTVKRLIELDLVERLVDFLINKSDGNCQTSIYHHLPKSKQKDRLGIWIALRDIDGTSPHPRIPQLSKAAIRVLATTLEARDTSPSSLYKVVAMLDFAEQVQAWTRLAASQRLPHASKHLSDAMTYWEQDIVPLKDAALDGLTAVESILVYTQRHPDPDRVCLPGSRITLQQIRDEIATRTKTADPEPT